ncbi:hypothetical protein PLICRDRAFT_40731 [Plicaturopsis crispa FD-325 SS-3]|nr:hypothetical protein PLICRDRAFT_40731 [Plicaturopsis crispa FD-325 SS-3]
MSIVSRIYIVRHGETDSNRAGIVQGHLDTSLNAVGLGQAKQTADILSLVPFQFAFSSDLKRAAKTAEIIVSQHPDLSLQKQEALRERYMGEIEGKTAAWSGPTPSAESTPDFSKRAVQWWNRTIGQSVPATATGDPPTNVLVVSHGGFIGILLTTLPNSRKLQCAPGVSIGRCFNASISVVEVGADGKGTLVQFGDISHLTGQDLVETNVDELEIAVKRM